VGVMALIVVIGVMTGFESDLKSRILGVQSHIVVKRTDDGFRDYPQAVEYLEKKDSVVSVTPFAYIQTMLRSPMGVSGAIVQGIDPERANQGIRNMDSSGLKKDTGLDPTLPGILLGQELARNLGVSGGDTIYLISPKGMISPVGHMPSMRKFEVRGIFETGMYEYDGSFAYIDLKEAQHLLRMGDTVTGIEIWLDNPEEARDVAKDISAHLGEGYQVQDWMQMNLNFFSALRLEKTVMFIILTLIVLVAAFNIAGSLIMTVMGKKRDIAILKAMGATDKNIRKIFVFNGTVIGCAGTFIGVCLGTGLCLLLKHYQFIQLPSDVYYITTIPVVLNVTDVVLIAVAALLICFLATLYPAMIAAKSDPLEALRYD